MRSSGVHHVDLVVSSIERSLPFYRDLLAPLGFHRIGEVEGERGETIWYIPGRVPRSGFARRRREESLGGVDRYKVGLHHLALEAGSHAVVDERHEWLVSVGATIESSRASTATSLATTRCSSTTRTGSSSRSSTCPDWPRRAPRT